MASYLSDNDVKLLSEPTEHSRRPMNRKAVKKRVDKMRSDALKNDEPLVLNKDIIVVSQKGKEEEKCRNGRPKANPNPKTSPNLCLTSIVTRT